MYFQAVRPQFILDALNWLKLNNPLYNNITVDINNISANLQNLGDENASGTNFDKNENSSTNTCKQDILTNNEDTEERDDPLNEYRQATNETCLQSVLPDYPVATQNNKGCSLGNEVFNIAPGENRHPVSIMTDKKCKELAFPALFPKGQFGYTEDRMIKLSPVKYFNARLLHYSGRFTMDPEYLLFAQFIAEHKKVSDSINIALKKIQVQRVTALQIKSDVNKLKGLICQDQAYLFLREIPGKNSCMKY